MSGIEGAKGFKSLTDYFEERDRKNDAILIAESSVSSTEELPSGRRPKVITPLRKVLAESLTSSEMPLVPSNYSPSKAQQKLLKKVSSVEQRLENPSNIVSYAADLQKAEALLKKIEHPGERASRCADVEAGAVFQGMAALSEKRAEVIQESDMNRVTKAFKVWRAKRHQETAQKLDLGKRIPAAIDAIKAQADSSKFSYVEIFPLSTSLKEFAKHKHCPRVTSQYFARFIDGKSISVLVEEDLTLEMLFRREVVVSQFPHLAHDDNAIKDRLKDILYATEGSATYVHLAGVGGSSGYYLLEVIVNSQTGDLEVAALATKEVGPGEEI